MGKAENSESWNKRRRKLRAQGLCVSCGRAETKNYHCTACSKASKYQQAQKPKPQFASEDEKQQALCDYYRAPAAMARFWTRVNKSGPTLRDELGPCWEWTSRRRLDGYGLIAQAAWHRAKTHRVAWMLHNGPIPAGLSVLHRCDNPPCCNPAHLFLGTRADNVRDMIEKGRRRTRSVPGEEHPNAKLTDDAVREIRRKYRRGSGRELASLFGINASTLYRIVNRQAWAHVDDGESA